MASQLSAKSCAPAKAYRPSNGSEGVDFDDRWCAHCTRDAAFRDDDMKDGCPIIAAAFLYDIDQPEYPKEWIEDDKGPRCTAFTTDKKPERLRCLETKEMFS